MKIGVVDYGMGNLHSVSKALAFTDAAVTISHDREKLKASDMLVLPGVGSFGAAMNNLIKLSLDGFIIDWIKDDRPFLGICLGLQLLFERSEESPKEKGLGIFPGRVVKFRPAQFKKGAYQVPHMGWNTLRVHGKEKLGLGKDDYFYFVHTYYSEPKDKKLVFTETNYGKPFCSAVRRGNLTATQFHPEKSGETGLKFLKNMVGKFS